MKKPGIRPRPSYGDLFEPWEIRQATWLVRDFLVTNAALRWTCEEADLLQEVLGHWHRVRGRYDPGRGASRKTFMDRVVKTRLCELLRGLETDRRRLQHLAEPLSGEASAALNAKSRKPRTVEDELERATARQHVEAGPVDELGDAVRDALPELGEREAAVAAGLAAKRPVAELAMELGVSRDTVYEDIKRIRRLFEARGLRRFLPESDTSGPDRI